MLLNLKAKQTELGFSLSWGGGGGGGAGGAGGCWKEWGGGDMGV